MGIRDIREKILNPQRENNKFFDYNLMVVLAFYLEARSIGIENTRIESIAESHLADVRAVHNFFFSTILPAIFAEKMDDEEVDVLLAELLGDVARAIQRPLYAITCA